MGEKFVVLHESDGRPYYKALERALNGQSVRYLESSIVRRSIWAALSGRYKSLDIIYSAIVNFLFRARIPLIRNKIIIMGMAPFDFRILFYKHLARQNTVVLHTSWPFWETDYIPRKYPPPILNIVRNIWRQFLIDERIKIVCVTEQVDSSLRRFSGRRSQTYVIPHVIDLPNNDQSYNDIKKSRNSILFVGKLIKEKGVEVLLDQLPTLQARGYRVTIAGSGPLSGKVLDACSKYENVQYLGFISDRSELANALLNSEFLIVPSVRSSSWQEIFGINIIEGMSAGCVVVSTDHVGPRSIISNGIDGILLSENDMRNFSSVLDRLTAEEKLSIARNAVSRSKNYSISELTPMWNAVLGL